MRSLGWAPIQSDWYAYKKRKFGYRSIQKEDTVKAQGEDSHLQGKERGLWRNQSCWHSHVGLIAYRTEKRNFCSSWFSFWWGLYLACGQLLSSHGLSLANVYGEKERKLSGVSSPKDTNPIGWGPTLMTSFSFSCCLGDPVSKYSHTGG